MERNYETDLGGGSKAAVGVAAGYRLRSVPEAGGDRCGRGSEVRITERNGGEGCDYETKGLHRAKQGRTRR